MSQFRKAERRRAKLRAAIDGPSGSGKTMSALLVARGIATGWDKIAVVDTENGSAELYVGAAVPGTHDKIGEYSVLTLNRPYTPDAYINAIRGAEAEGFEVVIIDSLSHAWDGEGGVLDMVDKASRAGRSGNSYTAWRDVTPKHNALVDAMLTSGIHVIATMRTKTEYIIEKDDRGKSVPRKVGMAPRQRDGMEYEFTLVLDLSPEHFATASKDRTGLFDGQPGMLNIESGARLKAWLESGVAAEARPQPAAPQREQAAPPAPRDPHLDIAAAVLAMRDVAAVGAKGDEHAEKPVVLEAVVAMEELLAVKSFDGVRPVYEARVSQLAPELKAAWKNACAKHATTLKDAQNKAA